MRLTLKQLLLVFITFIIYAFTGIFTKLASMSQFMSLKYILYFGCILVMLGSYAILWQKVLSFMELSKAFLFKSVSILITLCYSRILFSEHISLTNIIGACVIVSGLIILSWKK